MIAGAMHEIRYWDGWRRPPTSYLVPRANNLLPTGGGQGSHHGASTCHFYYAQEGP